MCISVGHDNIFYILRSDTVETPCHDHTLISVSVTKLQFKKCCCVHCLARKDGFYVPLCNTSSSLLHIHILNPSFPFQHRLHISNVFLTNKYNLIPKYRGNLLQCLLLSLTAKALA